MNFFSYNIPFLLFSVCVNQSIYFCNSIPCHLTSCNRENVKKKSAPIPISARNICQLSFLQKNKAADGNRTRDLRLTKATLYRLSHSSISISGHFCRSQLIILTEKAYPVNRQFVFLPLCFFTFISRYFSLEIF